MYNDQVGVTPQNPKSMKKAFSLKAFPLTSVNQNQAENAKNSSKPKGVEPQSTNRTQIPVQGDNNNKFTSLIPQLGKSSFNHYASQRSLPNANMDTSTSMGVDLHDISQITKMTQQQDKYLRSLNMNRRKQIEYQEKQAQEMLKVLSLKHSQSNSKILKKNLQMHERELQPGVNKFISDRNSILKLNDSSNHHNSVIFGSEIKRGRHQPNYVYTSGIANLNEQPDDEWQLRLKLISKLSEIQQKNKYFYNRLEDNYETEDSLKSKKYFSNAIREKIEGQHNDLPASLVALNYNRKFIMDQLLNRKGLVNPTQQHQTAQVTKLPAPTKDQKLQKGQDPHKESFVSSTDSDHKKSLFLQDLRKQSVAKFKEQFIYEEFITRKVQQQKKYQSRSQYDNAANQFRFLPPDRRKKIERDIKIVIDQNSRDLEMMRCLEQCIGGREIEEEDYDQQIEDNPSKSALRKQKDNNKLRQRTESGASRSSMKDFGISNSHTRTPIINQREGQRSTHSKDLNLNYKSSEYKNMAKSQSKSKEVKIKTSKIKMKKQRKVKRLKSANQDCHFPKQLNLIRQKSRVDSTPTQKNQDIQQCLKQNDSNMRQSELRNDSRLTFNKTMFNIVKNELNDSDYKVNKGSPIARIQKSVLESDKQSLNLSLITPHMNVNISKPFTFVRTLSSNLYPPRVNKITTFLNNNENSINNHNDYALIQQPKSHQTATHVTLSNFTPTNNLIGNSHQQSQRYQQHNHHQSRNHGQHRHLNRFQLYRSIVKNRPLQIMEMSGSLERTSSSYMNINEDYASQEQLNQSQKVLSPFQNQQVFQTAGGLQRNNQSAIVLDNSQSTSTLINQLILPSTVLRKCEQKRPQSSYQANLQKLRNIKERKKCNQDSFICGQTMKIKPLIDVINERTFKARLNQILDPLSEKNLTSNSDEKSSNFKFDGQDTVIKMNSGSNSPSKIVKKEILMSISKRRPSQKEILIQVNEQSQQLTNQISSKTLHKQSLSVTENNESENCVTSKPSVQETLQSAVDQNTGINVSSLQENNNEQLQSNVNECNQETFAAPQQSESKVDKEMVQKPSNILAQALSVNQNSGSEKSMQSIVNIHAATNNQLQDTLKLMSSGHVVGINQLKDRGWSSTGGRYSSKNENSTGKSKNSGTERLTTLNQFVQSLSKEFESKTQTRTVLFGNLMGQFKDIDTIITQNIQASRSKPKLNNFNTTKDQDFRQQAGESSRNIHQLGQTQSSSLGKSANHHPFYRDKRINKDLQIKMNNSIENAFEQSSKSHFRPRQTSKVLLSNKEAFLGVGSDTSNSMWTQKFQFSQSGIEFKYNKTPQTKNALVKQYLLAKKIYS